MGLKYSFFLRYVGMIFHPQAKIHYASLVLRCFPKPSILLLVVWITNPKKEVWNQWCHIQIQERKSGAQSQPWARSTGVSFHLLWLFGGERSTLLYGLEEPELTSAYFEYHWIINSLLPFCDFPNLWKRDFFGKVVAYLFSFGIYEYV